MFKVVGKIFGACFVIIVGVIATLMSAESLTSNTAVVWDKVATTFRKTDDDCESEEEA